jgi:hypothetical protein
MLSQKLWSENHKLFYDSSQRKRMVRKGIDTGQANGFHAVPLGALPLDRAEELHTILF